MKNDSTIQNENAIPPSLQSLRIINNAIFNGSTLHELLETIGDYTAELYPLSDDDSQRKVERVEALLLIARFFSKYSLDNINSDFSSLCLSSAGEVENA